jgi:ankyrin repeat protein
LNTEHTELANGDIKNDLHYAIYCKRATLIPLLLQYGCTIEAGDSCGRRPLHKAAAAGDTASIDILLAAGAGTHARDNRQKNALHYAADNGSCSAISTLLTRGLDIHAVDADKRTPLHLAATGYFEAYDLLINHGGDSSVKDRYGKIRICI